MTKFNSRQIENAMEFAKLMNQLGSFGGENFDKKYERTVKFIEKVNGIEDNMGEDKGLKVVDNNGRVELSGGDLKVYDVNGNLFLHIPKDGKNATLRGKVINSKESDKNNIETILKNKLQVLSNECDILNYAYGDNVKNIERWKLNKERAKALSEVLDLLPIQ